MRETDTEPRDDLLPGMDAELRACGVIGEPQLPALVSQLTRKEQTWFMSWLRTGNATEAARVAGYAHPESYGAKVQKSAGVRACMAQAAIPVAKNADKLVERVSERSRALHAMIDRELAKAETARCRKTVLQLTAAANRTDALLGSLLGKIAGVVVNGKIEHSHTHGGVVQVDVVPESAIDSLARVRREVQLTDRATAMAQGGPN